MHFNAICKILRRNISSIYIFLRSPFVINHYRSEDACIRNGRNVGSLRRSCIFLNDKKIIIRMKLTLLLLTAVISQCLAGVKAQINLNVKNEPVEKVILQLKKQTGYEFLFNPELLKAAGKATLTLQNSTLPRALNSLFEGKELTYEIEENTVIISRKQPPPVKSVTVKEPERIVVKSVSGTVKDMEGNPLVGVSVKVQGKNWGTYTDKGGRFTINAAPGDLIEFTYVGFVAQTVKFLNQEVLAIVLKVADNSLNEIITIGYGTQKRSEVISSVGTANVKDMQKAPVKSFEDALAGRIAGVQVASNEGGPLAANDIVIRGNSSLTQSNAPLWIIDGFAIEDAQNNSLNPDDIESITVLKDAASTAIYGSRGANGVILVTTKSGKVGAPVITFDGSYGFSKTLRFMEMMNAYDYVKMQTELFGAAKVLYTPGDSSLIGTSDYIEGGRTLDYYKTQQSIDWQKLLFRTAPFKNYLLRVSGGTDMTKYLVSGSYTEQLGTILKTGFKRYQGRFTLDQKLRKNLRLNVNVNYARTSAEGSLPSAVSNSTMSLLYSVWGYRPAYSANTSYDDVLNSSLDPDGMDGYSYNPISTVKNTDNNTTNNNLSANAYFEYKVIPNLTLRISGGINYYTTKRMLYYGLDTYQGSSTVSATGPNGTITNTSFNSILNENTLTYNKHLGKAHNLNAVVGYSSQRTQTSVNGLTAIQVPNDVLGVNGLDEGTPYSLNTAASENLLISTFGRVNYNYDSKYYASVTLRADGSSKFAPGNQWGYFPAAALSWNITREKFMKALPWISELKLRGTYGTSGNNRINDFAYLPGISLSTISNYYSFAGQYVKGATQAMLANKDIKWETTGTADFGLDFSVLNGRLSLVVDYYKKKTTNLLLNATLPGHTGYSTGLKNIGSVQNTGWEFTLNTKNITHADLEWVTNFNIAFNKNKVLSLTSGQEALLTPIAGYDLTVPYPYMARVGEPIAQIFGYKWVGNYQYSDFDLQPNGTYVLKANVPANGSARASIKPGDIKYEDINGDGNITAADQVVIGNPNPLFTGGFSNDFTYRRFNLNVLFTFSYGNDVLNANRLKFEGGGTVFNQFVSYNDRWSPDNQTNRNPRAGSGYTTLISSRVIEDGSFLRLKTVSLGYNFSNSLLEKWKIKTARVFCSAQNIYVWDHYQGSDPEVSTRPGALTPGFDFAAYPREFTMTFGVNLSF